MVTLIADEAAGEIGALQIEVAVAEAAQIARGIEGADFGGEEVVESEEAGDFEAGGLGEDLAGSAGLGDGAVEEDVHFIAKLAAFVEAVGDEEDGEGELFADLAEDRVHFGAEGSVEALGGLVEEEDFGAAEEGAGDGAALFLAAGELVGEAGGEAGEAEAVEHFVGAAAALDAGKTAGGEGEVLA